MIKAKLTDKGIKAFDKFIDMRKQRQEKILNSGFDTMLEPLNITQADIECDILEFGDDEGYYNSWAVTDNPKYDIPLLLIKDKDYIIYETD